MNADGERRPALGENTRLGSWALNHPLKFAAAGSAVFCLLVLITMGTWAVDHPLQAAIRVPVGWLLIALVLWLATRAKR